ncbi:hypothetical protein P3T37_001482 [Kitasatospora sp. MAA4]|uniref:nSTAND1 domain-containing NTPase n=1 Tax=Kitasatospora sp. MAA4 TaxID=3035093 RepID=UPI0024754DBC|nr:hypothetical protein [Kitasatospora sp. MAA4]MDH6132097.1 hypothetical protein [Kitasatospora sp. MAA4]
MSAGLATKPAESASSRRNPYVGPRAFQMGEHLPNRGREARELANLVIAERVVLLHSPSGAGKTSLIQSTVMEELADHGFRPVGPARVDKPPPQDLDIHNRYVYSLALYLLGQRTTDPQLFQSYTLKQVLDQVTAETVPSLGPREAQVLVIDQFEEILTLDPTDWDAKTAFFEELGGELADRRLWLLLAMREDYMGGLHRYRLLVPGHLRAKYRLEFLTRDEAQLAIQRPAEDRNVTFSDPAANALIEKLAMTMVSSPDHKCEWQQTPYVEPFQLQVVCSRLWRTVRSAKADAFDSIDSADVETVDIDRALSRFYADTVADAAKETHVSERAVRDWFEYQLITPEGFRSQTVARPVMGDEGVQLLRLLEDAYLIRADTRAQTTWYELEHDRLIRAVRRSNELWRWENLAFWQIAAHEWQRSGRPRARLFSARDLARFGPGRDDEPTALEHQFLDASKDDASRGRWVSTALSVVGVLTALVVVETVVIAILLALWL